MNKMKLLLSVILFVATVGTALAQVEVGLGLKGGLNFANVNTSSVGAAYNSRTGYHVGAFALFKFTKIAIQPELIYSQQGTTFNVPSVGDFETTFNYVNIPIILKFYIVGGLNLQLGPQFGFLSSSEGPIPNSSPITSGSLNSFVKSSDFSVGMGAGFDLPLKLSIDARYNLGVSDISDSAAISATKNQVFQLSLGFKLFQFGK